MGDETRERDREWLPETLRDDLAARAEIRRLAARVEELEVEVARLTDERDKARGNYQWMVERAADERLDGYRELGARAAASENEVDRLKAEVARLKDAADEPAGWRDDSAPAAYDGATGAPSMRLGSSPQPCGVRRLVVYQREPLPKVGKDDDHG